MTDLLRAAWLGISGRVARSLLAGLAVAVGLAATVALSGIAASNRAALLARLDALGANLSVIEPGKDAAGRSVRLPDWSPQTLARQPGVQRVGVFRTAPEGMQVFRNDLVPRTNGNGLSVNIASPGVLEAIGVAYASGHGWEASVPPGGALPVAVLGSQAAYRLGVREAGDRVLIDGVWYGVTGVLDDVPQAAALNTAVVIPESWAAFQYPDLTASIHAISAIYVRTTSEAAEEPGTTEPVRRMLAHAANPSGGVVSVTASADLSKARGEADGSLASLGMLIGAVSLAVGGIVIANTMAAAVMERREEIGLRRSLGATAARIRLQFVIQSAMLAGLSGAVGLGVGTLTVWLTARLTSQPFVPDWPLLPEVWAVAVLAGVAAGLRPAGRAARMAPMDALRTD